MATPSPDDLRFAADWLRCYDDEHDGGGDTRRMEAVAAWLDARADAREVRAVARESGVPVAKLREKLREIERA